ncbi:hypothetical protein [Calothrix sp. UHCC 0171]|uniref:hypothetical protein n=1 Tax=Calothrix sp. UHCC 0171 TaxID=3110245 RepID=UPI002B1F1F90|nr:hypothetical protein [Calothrix sp. UHCC 0171]MEA5572522.1 hypothetical protein [Calothrix sp. UHCC 0171]
MLNKSLALGVLAAFAMAPAAFAGDQVQGNVTNTQINAGNVGSGNVTGITNSTGTNQSQAKFGGRWCRTSGNQVQGNATNTGISAGNVGVGNVTGISNSTGTNQSQVAGSGCYFRY